ncbi:hypothetical protein Tco_0526069 [Tanacetum coccineum]
MMKLPTLKEVATLVTWSVIISECLRLKRKKIIDEEKEPTGVKNEERGRPNEVNLTGDVLVNPAFPNQLVIIGGGLSEECKSQLKLLLEQNLEIFAWHPSDMMGVPKQIIEHVLNANVPC